MWNGVLAIVTSQTNRFTFCLKFNGVLELKKIYVVGTDNLEQFSFSAKTYVHYGGYIDYNELFDSCSVRIS